MAKGASCLIITKDVRKVAEKLHVSDAVAKANIELWLEEQRKAGVNVDNISFDQYFSQISSFISERHRSAFDEIEFASTQDSGIKESVLASILKADTVRNLAESFGIKIDVADNLSTSGNTTKTKATMKLTGDFVSTQQKKLFAALLVDLGYVDESDVSTPGFSMLDRLEIYYNWMDWTYSQNNTGAINQHLKLIDMAMRNNGMKIETEYMFRKDQLVSKWGTRHAAYRDACHEMAWCFSDKLTKMYNAEVDDLNVQMAVIKDTIAFYNEELKELTEQNDIDACRASIAENEQKLNELEKKLNGMSRLDYLMEINPKTVFDAVIKDWVAINDAYKTGDIAKIKAAVRNSLSLTALGNISNDVQGYAQNFQRRIDTIYAIVLDSLNEINRMELVSINPDNIEEMDMTSDEYVDDSSDVEDNITVDGVKILEKWQYDVDTQSVMSKLGTKIRNMLSTIPQGKMKTSYGIPIYWNPSKVVVELIKMLEPARTSSEMLQIMRDNAVNHMWMEEVINRLKNDNQLRALFFRKFSNCRKSFLSLSARTGMNTFLNYREQNLGTFYTSYNATINNGLVLVKDYSMYDNLGNVDRAKSAKMYNRLKMLFSGTFLRYKDRPYEYGDPYKSLLWLDYDKFRERFSELRYEDKEQIRETLYDALNGIGIAVEYNTVNKMLLTRSKNGKSMMWPIFLNLCTMYYRASSVNGIESMRNFANSDEVKKIYNAGKQFFDDTDVEDGMQAHGKYYYSFGEKSRLDEITMMLDDDKSFREYYDKYGGDPFYFYRTDEDDTSEPGWETDEGKKSRERMIMDDDYNVHSYCLFMEIMRNGGLTQYLDDGTTRTEKPYEMFRVAKLLFLEDTGDKNGYKEYGKWTKEDWRDIIWNMYNNRIAEEEEKAKKDSNYTKLDYGAWYPLFATSDTQSAFFMRFPKLLRKSLVHYTALVARTELERMIRCPKMKNVPACFKTRGLQFCFLEECNNTPEDIINGTNAEPENYLTPSELEHVKELKEAIAASEIMLNGTTDVEDADKIMEISKRNGIDLDEEHNNLTDEARRNAEDNLLRLNAELRYYQHSRFMSTVRTKGKRIDAKKILSIYKKASEEERDLICTRLAQYWLDEKVRNDTNWTDHKDESKQDAGKYELFLQNEAFVQMQMHMMFLGDLAMYPSNDAITKRCKELIVPKDKVDFDNPDGKTEQRVLYVDDEIAKSTNYDKLKEVLDKLYADGRMTQTAYMNILNGLQEINITDGQAYRTFDSMLDILVMRGELKKGDDRYNALIRIANGTATVDDYAKAEMSMPAKKSFTNGITKVEWARGKFAAMPYQLKLSEQVLAAAFMNNVFSNSPVLQAINEVAKEKNIDFIVFSSAVKIGNNGSVRISDPEGREEGAKERIKHEILDQINANESTMIHVLPYEDYGIVSEVHDESFTGQTKLGTQITKFMDINLPDTVSAGFEINGITLNSKEICDLYHNIMLEILSRKFNKLFGVMLDRKKLSARLRNSSRKADSSSDAMTSMFELDENGHFIIPLSDLSSMRMSSNMLNAIIRQELADIKFDGGGYVQTSAFGLNDELKIEFDDEGKMTIPIYITPWHMDLIRKYMDKNGYIDVNDIAKDDPSILEMFGFRIPTEGKHFAMSFKVAGILPRIMGSTLIMPSDIITLTDSDFDIDKIYMMMHRLKAIRYDFDRALSDFANEDEDFAKILHDDNGKTEPHEWIDKDGRFGSWFRKRMRSYLLAQKDWKIITAKFDLYSYRYKGKMISDYSMDELKNGLIDVMRAMLQSPDVAEQTITSGDISPATEAAAKMRRLMGRDKESLPACDINSVLERRTRNNEGKEMIEVFAASNASHAICQHTDLALAEGLFVNIFGKSLNSLHDQYSDGTKEYIIKVLGTCIGAATDNVNYPTLSDLNMNKNTSYATTLMLRLGFSIEDVALFLNMKVIRDYASGENLDKGYKVKKYYNSVGDLKLTLDYTKEQLEECIRADYMSQETYENLSKDEKAKIDAVREDSHTMNQAVLDVFTSLQAIGQQLLGLDSMMKNDTGNGVPKGSLEKNIYRQVRFRTLQSVLSNPVTSFLSGWENIVSLGNKREDFRRVIDESPIPVAQAYTSYMMDGAFDVLSRLYPGLKVNDNANISYIDIIYNTVTEFFGQYYNEKDVRNIMTNLFNYMQSNFMCFCREGMTIEESRAWYMNEFPQVASEIVSRYNIGKYKLFQRMKFTDVESEYNSRLFILYDNEGRISKEERDVMTREWESLLYLNPELKQLAIDLFIYSYWRNGAQFGNKTFVQLCPSSVKEAIPGYVSSLNAMQYGITGNGFNYNRWMVEFLRNNIRNNRYCIELSKNTKSLKQKNSTNSVLELDMSVLNNKDWKKYVKYFSENHTNIDKVRVGTPVRAFNDKGDYYILSEINRNRNTAIYIKVTPLGFGSEAHEYNCGKGIDPFTMRTVYDQSTYRTRKRKRADARNLFKEKNSTKLRNEIKKTKRMIESIRIRLADENISDTEKKILESRLDDYTKQMEDLKKRYRNRKLRKKAKKAYTKRKENQDKVTLNELVTDLITEKKYDYDDASEDDKTLYVFIDNGDRSSGTVEIDPESIYAKKYGHGKTLYRPEKATTACVRGLKNAMPLTLIKHYVKGETVANRWTDGDIEEFESIIKADIDAIINEFNNGDYERIVWPGEIISGDDITGGKLANLPNALSSILSEEIERLKDEIIYEPEEDNNREEDDESDDGNDSESREDDGQDDEQDDSNDDDESMIRAHLKGFNMKNLDEKNGITKKYKILQILLYKHMTDSEKKEFNERKEKYRKQFLDVLHNEDEALMQASRKASIELVVEKRREYFGYDETVECDDKGRPIC